MANALPAERYAVTVFDVAGQETRESSATAAGDGLGSRPRHACLPVEWKQLTTTLYTSGFDVVLPALHGGWGEDGTLQALLDVAGIPYVGSGPRASVIAMDKQSCKAVMKDQGLKVPPGRVINDIGELDEIAPAFKKGCVVKPNGGGSSVGVSILRPAADGSSEELLTALHAAIDDALADGSGALIEELVEGTEVTAAVLGTGDKAQVLPLLEIVPQRGGGFFDYEAKYTQGGAQHIIPPRLPQPVLDQIAEQARKVHQTLNCRGVSRSDFIVTEDHTPYFLEINTLPGMTEMSLVPDCARAAGISFSELLEKLIDQALGR